MEDRENMNVKAQRYQSSYLDAFLWRIKMSAKASNDV